MHSHNITHYFHLKSELHELYFSISLRTFAILLINIFIPIYLLQKGFSLQVTLLFYSVVALTHSFVAFPAAKLSSKIGVKHLAILSVPFLMIYYLLLHSVQTIDALGIPIVVIAIFGGISSALFWIGHHSDFAKVSDVGKTGKEIGIVKIFIGIATAIGPVIGAFLLTWFGFNTLFMVVSLILFLSIIPLIKHEDKHESFYFSFEDFKQVFRKEDMMGHIGYGIEAPIYQVIWPLFIFFFVLDQGITALGSVSSLSLLFSLMMTYIIANNIDRKTNLFNDLGAIITAGIWLIKNSVVTGAQVLMIDSLAGLSSASKNISFDKIGYDRAKRRKILQYITFREFFINFSAGIIFLLLTTINENIIYTVGFGIAALGSMLFLFFRDK